MTLGPIKIPPFGHPSPPPAPPPATPAPGSQTQNTSYAVQGWGCMFYGSGHDIRAQVSLATKHGDGPSSAAWLRFFDEGQPLPADYVQDGTIRMHMPMTALAGTLELLKAVGTTGALSVYLSPGSTTAILDYTSYGSD